MGLIETNIEKAVFEAINFAVEKATKEEIEKQEKTF